MTGDYFLVLFLLFCLTVTAQPNPMPGPPIFYKTSTFAPVCYLPPDSGACLKEGKDVEQKGEIRYYFDVVTEDCYPFTFLAKPCSENANNFKTAAECRSYCKLV